MARICPLFSGSTGNSTYIKDGDCGILIDAGVSCKRIFDAVLRAGGTPESIKAIAVTHEHIDHIKGLKVIMKKLNVPVYGSYKTLLAVRKELDLPDDTNLVPFSDTVSVGDMGFSRFDTSHDCEGSSGYNIFLKDGRKVTVCTDLGVVTDVVRSAVNGSELVLFESNYDVEMLRNGPYPQPLKLRILSEKGHLSNINCACELPGFLNSGTTRFILGHLSRHNNIPMLAKNAAKNALYEAGAKENEDYIITVASPGDNEMVAI